MDHLPYLAPTLVFVHVMKTGGTSLTEWIQRHYEYDDVLFEASIWRDFWEVPLERLERKRFIRGHFGSYIARYFKPIDGFRYITILRNPVERVISNFWHSKRSADDGLNDLVSHKDFGLGDYLEHPRSRPFACNYQVRNFAYDINKNYRTRKLAPHLCLPYCMGNEDLERAKAFLDSVDLVGFSEDLPRAMEIMSQRFGFFLDENLGRHRSYRDVRESVSEQTLKKIRELNELDLCLYEWARVRDARGSRMASRGPYRWARALYSYARKSIRDRPPAKVIPMSNPLDGTEDKLIHWNAKNAFFATGWSDVQSPDWLVAPPHRWSLRHDPKVLLLVRRDARYLLTFEIFRFVTEDQVAGFSLLIDQKKVSLIGPVKCERSGPGGGVFAADLGRQSAEHCSLTFHVDSLKSFNDANPEDPDKTPFGLALASMTLLMLD